MTFMQWLGAVLSTGLFFYLLYALFRAEKF
jgi:K+-transporting ATPase KdpF subunit